MLLGIKALELTFGLYGDVQLRRNHLSKKPVISTDPLIMQYWVCGLSDFFIVGSTFLEKISPKFSERLKRLSW